MSGVRSEGPVLKIKELQPNDLKRIIAHQHKELLAKNERSKRPNELTRICSELEEKRQDSETKADNYETALRRAETRIAHLNKKLGIGRQTTFGIDVVSPRISRKDYDAVTKENIRLKEALGHIVPTELGGKDIVIKNRELYELVTTLRDDLAQCEHHIKELESILASKEDDLAVKVNQLTKQNMKLGRSMQAKQVFSEKLLKENKRLNEIVDQQKGLVVADRDVPDGQAIEDKMNPKNHELYQLVTTLRDDLVQCEHHIKELESILASKEDDLAVKVNQLTKQNDMKLERSMQAKQVFSEKLLKENKRLVDQQKGLVVVHRDVPDGQAIEDKMNPMNENATASATNAVSNKEQEKMVEKKEKVILEQAAKIQELLTKIENASKRIAELSTEVAKTNEGKQKVEFELSETAKKCSDFQKKCAYFFNQVVNLNSKQQESAAEEISSLKHACENLRAQGAEKEAMMVMMRDSLKTYENDLRSENKEKAGIQKRMETAQQESERLRRENQTHMATIRHFESENERMSKLLTDEKNRNKNTTSFQTSFAQRCGSNVPRSFFQDRTLQPIAIAGCGVGGVNMPTQEEGASSETIIKEKERIISEQRTKMNQMQKEIENLLKQVAELTSESLEEKPRAHGAEKKGMINMVMGFQYLANCTFAN